MSNTIQVRDFYKSIHVQGKGSVHPIKYCKPWTTTKITIVNYIFSKHLGYNYNELEIFQIDLKNNYS